VKFLIQQYQMVWNKVVTVKLGKFKSVDGGADGGKLEVVFHWVICLCDGRKVLNPRAHKNPQLEAIE